MCLNLHFLVLVFIFHNFRAHAKMIILAYFNSYLGNLATFVQVIIVLFNLGNNERQCFLVFSSTRIAIFEYVLKFSFDAKLSPIHIE